VALARQAQGLPRLPTVQEGPIKLFDNLTYIGFNDVGAWVVPTSAGIILFDTLNSTADAMNVIEPEMQKAGLDPAQIKYILVGHGHADHFGGANYLQMKYHAKVLAAMPDWAAMQRGGRGNAAPGFTPDGDVTDGQKLTLGDTTITLIRLPGHTPGTIGMVVPAKFGGRTHDVAIMSGTQMPTQDSLDAFKHVFNDELKKLNVESFLGSHPDILMNSLMTMEAIRDKYPTGMHPLLLAKNKADRYMDIILECARARLAAQGKLTATN
jgi:metallo-beta-lactamase class B